MADQRVPCFAKNTNGEDCRKMARRGDRLCGLHCAKRRQLGEHFFQWIQVCIVGRQLSQEVSRIRIVDPARAQQLRDQVRNTYITITTRHREAIIANGGVDPHPMTEELGRVNIPKRIRYLRLRQAPGDGDELVRLRQQAEQQAPAVGVAVWVDPDAETESDDDDGGLDLRRFGAAAGPAARPVGGEDAQIARDNQGVHRERIVKQTKEIVARVIKIPVPDEYKWSTGSVKTPGEIMMECKITQAAGWQLMSQYAQPVSIYDMGAGIYGKVLDSVWQYIKGSPDKADLCRILKQEMQDNVGMCAQGNLTRICNILAGYMEGVGSTESLAERLGRLMPGLMSVEDQKERVRQAVNLLKENGAPREEWADWVGALVDDGDVDELIAAV
jgi:hypothetical protein